jgi:hypothetical protein
MLGGPKNVDVVLMSSQMQEYDVDADVDIDV